MPKRIALVGHCGADASYLRVAVSRAVKDAVIVRVDEQAELHALLDNGSVDLVLMNRQLDWGFDTTEGVEIIRWLRDKHPAVRTMLVSNLSEAQQAAVAAGALPGFGKRQLGDSHVAELIRQAVSDN
jgi:DNA-binding NarL/FixJ family response regulator